MNGSSGTEPPSSASLRETVWSILMRNTGTKLSSAVIDQTVNQLMHLMPERNLPTVQQMEEMIDLAYKLGWKDRGQSIFRTTAPTVTIKPNPDGSWTFLYDGNPRP